MPSADVHDYTLPAVLDANAARAAIAALDGVIAGARWLRLDGMQVTRVTTPGVQFLVAARAQAQASGTTLALPASPALLHALEALGLQSLFQSQIEEGQ